MDPRLFKQLHEMETNHWWFAGRRRILSSVLDRLEIRAKSILDVGCGVGTNLDLFNDRYAGRRIHGIDIELEPLRFCLLDHAFPVCRADLANLPFKAEAFDLVCALDSLEHVPDDTAALRGLYNVCRPGGALLLTVPAFGFLWGNIDRVGHHYRRYTSRDLVTKVVAAGFSVRFVRYFNYLLFPPIAAIRLLARFRPNPDSSDAGAVSTDFDIVKSGLLNKFLGAIFALEASLLRFRPPFGVSLLCVAVRGGGRGAPAS